MMEIRLHGRGGQGIVTASELMALSAHIEGYEAQAFPAFGVERSGAPIQAFVRISRQPIVLREQVYEPDFLIIADSTLLGDEAIVSGIKKNTKIIVNSSAPKEEILRILPGVAAKNISVIPATDIARRYLNKPFANTALTGAFAFSSRLISLPSLLKAIEENFAGRNDKLIKDNKQAAIAAYEYES
ncbi:MAG: 2-oxoacid:acceptor oxidoreductase family protein [Bacillota bacterium]